MNVLDLPGMIYVCLDFLSKQKNTVKSSVKTSVDNFGNNFFTSLSNTLY